MITTDHCFGLAWSGGMSTALVSRLVERLPPGTAEIYFHPASRRDALLDRLMPHYDHEGELAALLDPSLAGRIAPIATDWSRLEAGGP